MRIATAILLSLIALSAITTSNAQTTNQDWTARVTEHGGNKYTLDWSTFRQGASPADALFVKVLQNDLQMTGCFVNQRTSPADFRMVGSVAAAGNRLTVQVSAVNPYNDSAYGQAFEHVSNDAAVRQLAHRIADELVETIARQKGIAQTQIALIGTASRNKELYLAEAYGYNPVKITADKSVSLNPNWTKSGQSIIYTSYLMGYPDVIEISLKTGKRERISNYPGLNTGGAVSPDGQHVALVLSKDGRPELYVKHLGSGRLTRLTKTRSSPKSSPSWSPDGNQIVFVSGHEGGPLLYTVTRNGGRINPLRLGGAENVSPDWGADGRICYAARVSRDHYTIRVFDPSSRENRIVDVTPNQRTSFEDPSWAGNGRHIYCGGKDNHRSSIYLLDTLGDRPIALISSGKGDWYSPEASP
jgi:TolB protein